MTLIRAIYPYLAGIGVACILYALYCTLAPRDFALLTGCALILWLWIDDAHSER